MAVLVASNPNIEGTKLSTGDEIGVFTPGGLCVGAAIWKGTNAGITVWGDNSQTPPIDGIRGQEQMSYRVWQQSTNTEYLNVVVTYSLGDGIYNANGTYVVASLTAAATPLPIQLSSFSATSVGDRSVLLKWTTMSEVNNYGFYVDRRGTRESTFSELPNSFIAGGGTTLVPRDYSYRDSSLTKGAWWYRLKQVDLDGTTNFTNPVLVNVLTSVSEAAPTAFALLQNYPNPFNPFTEIKFTVDASTHTTLAVYNALGETVAMLFDDAAEPGRYYRVTLDGRILASGVYLYRLQSGSKSQIRKLLLLK